MKHDAQSAQTGKSRREFLGTTGKVAVASALAGAVLPRAYAADNNTINLALIGCGGRGCGAAANALESPQGPVKLVAMADLFKNRLDPAAKMLASKFGDHVDVPVERQFIGFDAYKKAIDCLKPGDVALLTGYAGFRPGQLEYAVQKGINVFMEKSFAADPPGARRVIQAGEDAKKKNLKIAAGLMCRHSKNRMELMKHIKDGQLGQIQLIRGYRMQPCGPLPVRPAKVPDLEWQIRNFTHFFWVSGALFAEMDIHQIDEFCWIKDSWPVSAHGVCGRIAGSTDTGQNHDSFTIEWTFADGTKAFHTARWLPKCFTDFATYIHGTKCAAQFSGSHHAGTVQTYKDQRIADDNTSWVAEKEEVQPWQAEWDHLLESIRKDREHNEAKRAAMSNLADIMGRAAAHSGQLVTWDQVMASNFQFNPKIDELTMESEPPIKADAQGRYPVPVPGEWKEI
ncbi:MAG TPA: gfo/Idh/MocA family oxidoreductase [Planctomycetota bacterium]|jgi:predicted dehydrogenase